MPLGQQIECTALAKNSLSSIHETLTNAESPNISNFRSSLLAGYRFSGEPSPDIERRR